MSVKQKRTSIKGIENCDLNTFILQAYRSRVSINAQSL